MRLPQSVHEALERSKPSGVSLNQEIVDRLAASLGVGFVRENESAEVPDFVTGQRLATLEAELENLREIIRGVDNRLSALAANSK